MPVKRTIVNPANPAMGILFIPHNIREMKFAWGLVDTMTGKRYIDATQVPWTPIGSHRFFENMKKWERTIPTEKMQIKYRVLKARVPGRNICSDAKKMFVIRIAFIGEYFSSRVCNM